jgi:protease-4
MKNPLKRLGCAFLIVVLAVLAASLWLERAPRIEPGSTLVVELQGDYIEAAEAPLLLRLARQRQQTFLGLLSRLRVAERDSRIAAVVLRVRDLDIGWAKAQELRDAIAALNRAGKRTVAYLELEAFGANLEYYVASAANGIHVAPGTTAPVVGLAAEYLFLGGLWEKLGVDLEVERVGAYKTATDFLAGHEMTEAGREMANSLLDSVDAQFVSGIAKGRGLDEAAVRAAIDAAPVRAEEMLQLGLIDGVSSFDEVTAALGDGPVVEPEDYASVGPGDVGIEPVARVALVYGSGAVTSGEGTSSPTGAPVLASDTVSKALEDAAKDDSIAAILFRIDSPGGSALASDNVWQAIQKVRKSGKPFVVSMSDVAASGGYYVACGADYLMADPATLTGSIGVFVLRPVLRDLYAKLDIGVAGLTRGAHAELLLASQPLSPASRERLRLEVDSIYDLFVKRVSAGRHMTHDQVDAIGRGRVWTGAQAAERGLVDGLGGLRAAVDRVKQQLELAPDSDVELVVYPRPKSLAEQLDELLRRAALAAFGAHPAVELARRLEPWWMASGSPAALPPFEVEIR